MMKLQISQTNIGPWMIQPKLPLTITGVWGQYSDWWPQRGANNGNHKQEPGSFVGSVYNIDSYVWTHHKKTPKNFVHTAY